MSDKSSLIRAFNAHFFDFLDDILSIFPDNVSILTAKKSAEFIKKANPTAIIKAWYSFIYLKYKDVIDTGDISFFFDKDYSTDLESLSNSNEILKIVDTLREPVRNMSPASKDHTAKYIQNLSKISNAYSLIK